MLDRALAIPLHRAAVLDEPVLLQGPRGAGKSALLRLEFPAHTYVALDDAADRVRARKDPQAFLSRLRGPSIIDDIHRAPELLALLAQAVHGRPHILCSSRRLQLPFDTFELYPPTQAERAGRKPVSLEMLGRFAPAQTELLSAPWPLKRTYIERDVRDLIGVHDLDRFELFAQAAEARSGQILDQQELARACAVSHRTVTRWLALLYACFQTLLIPPSLLAFGRRLMRSPKLHFLASPALESQAVWEIYANARHAGITPELTYWRDSNGFEIPLIVQPETAPPMPVIIAEEPNPTEVARLHRWMQLASVEHGALIARRAGRLRQRGIVSYSITQL